MKLCRDCRHIQRDEESNIVPPGICLHPSIMIKTTNYVTGEIRNEGPSCQLSRTLGACGKEGVLWEYAWEYAVSGGEINDGSK